MNIDPNAVASQLLTELVGKFLAKARDSSADAFLKAHAYLFENFSDYLEITLNRCSYVRTIINKDKSFPIKEIYVHGKFKDGTKSISDHDLIQNFRDGQHSVVLGFGGIGKTVFMKYLWICIFDNPEGKIPIFIELRRLNQITDVDLKTYVRRTITTNRTGLDEKIFTKFLNDGRFAFVLDGFDELLDSKKTIVAEEILSLSHEFSRNSIIVSSRFDDRFSSWQSFHIYRAIHFNKDQVLDLVNKISYDKITKKKFISDIVEKSYDNFQSFLSTPLLSLMMLMTYSQFGEVPNKRHIFYRYAFMTLYAWHDSSKEIFNRQRQTGLLLDQFEKAFSIFCLISYLDGVASFDYRSIIEYLDKSKRYLEFEYDSRLFLEEIINNVNLMYVDGDQYLFTHRSFQEYFTACACVNYFQSKISALVSKLNRSSDIALGLMYEINPSAVMENFLYNEYQSKKDEISKLLSISDPRIFLEEIDIQYVVLIGSSDDRFSVNLFSVNTAHEIDEFMSTASMILDSHPDIRIHKNSTNLDPSIETLEKFFAPRARKISKPGESVLFSYSSKTNTIMFIKGTDFRSIVDLFEQLDTQGQKIDFDAKGILKHMENRSVATKAKYVAIDKVCRSLCTKHNRSSRDIEDLLSE